MSTLVTLFDSLRSELLAGRTGADTTLRQLVQHLLAADPEETLVGQFETLAERSLTTGWIGSRLAYLSNRRTAEIFEETAAAILATMAGSPLLAAAFATQLQRWPTRLARLTATSAERIDGTGAPNGRSKRTLSVPQQRVAIAVEAGRRLEMSQGRLDALCAQFEKQAVSGRWNESLIALLPAALAGVTTACDDRRLEPVRSRTYRVSPAHQIAEPKLLEAIQKRQRIARRHVSAGPTSLRRPNKQRPSSFSR